MIKRLGILAGICMLLGTAAFAANVRTVEINGQRMISLRDFGDRFDATITSNDDRDGFTIILDYQYVDMTPYSNWAWIDDHKVRLKAPVVIIDDVTYLPLDFLLDAFDLACERVNYDTQIIFIRHRPSFRVILVLDNDWGRQRHNWRHRYDCRDYFNFRITINIGDRRRDRDGNHRYDRTYDRPHGSRPPIIIREREKSRPPIVIREREKSRPGILDQLFGRKDRPSQHSYDKKGDRPANDHNGKYNGRDDEKDGKHDSDKSDDRKGRNKDDGKHRNGNSKNKHNRN